MTHTNEQKEAVKQLLVRGGAKREHISDDMVQRLLNDPSQVEQVMDQYNSDNFKRNILAADSKMSAEFVSPELMERIRNDEFISREERESFENRLHAEKARLQSNASGRQETQMDARQAVAKDKNGLLRIIRKHRIWRNIFLVLIGLISAAGTVGVILETMESGRVENLVAAAVSAFFLWMSVRIVFKFDPLLFSGFDTLLDSANELSQSESLIKGLISSELDERGVSHKLKDAESDNFIAFFRKAYHAIADHEGANGSKGVTDLEAKIQSLEGEVNHLNLALENSKKTHRDEVREKEKEIGAGAANADTKLLVTTLATRLKLGGVTESAQAKELIESALGAFPDLKDEVQALAYASEEHKRINQYDTIMQLYNEKIAKVRAQDMDEEDRDDAIAHWKRLRDTEVEELTRASDV